MKAYSKAVDDFDAAFVDRTAPAAEREAIARIAHAQIDPATPFATFQAQMEDDAIRINRGLALSMASLVEQLEWFKSEGMVKDTITPAMLFDTSYVETI